jgi:hypothetical protein
MDAFEKARNDAAAAANEAAELVAKAHAQRCKLDGGRELLAHIIDIIQESIQTDGDFHNTIERERSPLQWQYFDGYLNARKLDLDHLYRLRDFLAEDKA